MDTNDTDTTTRPHVGYTAEECRERQANTPFTVKEASPPPLVKRISEPMTPRTATSRQDALDYIAAAQTLLYKAASVSCDLRGWADQWRAIGDQADEVKALWHACNDAPLPIGHDSEPRTDIYP